MLVFSAGVAAETRAQARSAFRRTIDVQGLLELRGHHRVPIPDLIVAAAAEQAGAVLLHYDADFDRIVAVTGQEMEWVAPRGSV